MNSLYNFTLLVHSWNRWIILLAGLAVIILAIKGLAGKGQFASVHRKSSLIFISSLHLQLLIGLLLYFVLSPFTMQALSDFGAAMKDSTLRYWAVEHSVVNILAIAIAQVGSILAKRKTTDQAKFKTTLIWTAVAYILILAMIPMGMMGEARPWFRF